MNEQKLQWLWDRGEIIDVVNTVARAADFRDWAGCREVFADTVEVDYTSLAGGKPETMSANTLMERWQSALGKLDTTQHLLSNHAITVDDDFAFCVCEFQATHVLAGAAGGDLWTLGGVYNHTLMRTTHGWKVTKIKMTAKWNSGNKEILTEGVKKAT